MPKVSDEHKDAVRRRIMDAALTCLLRNSFQDVTTRELVGEAGLSTGTFYNYFPSKELLYEALAEELLTEDLTRLRAEGGAGEGLLRFLADYVLVEPEAAVAVSTFRGRMHPGSDAHDAIRRLNEFVVREFSPLVARAQAEGFLDPTLDPDAVVELLDIVWDGLGRRAATATFQTSYERVGATVLAILVGGALGPTADATRVDTAPRPTPPRPAKYTLKG